MCLFYVHISGRYNDDSAFSDAHNNSTCRYLCRFSDLGFTCRGLSPAPASSPALSSALSTTWSGCTGRDAASIEGRGVRRDR